MSIQSTQSISGDFHPVVASITPTGSSTQQRPSVEVKVPTQQHPVDAELLQKAVDEANQVFQETRTDVRFVIDEASKKVIIKLIEPSSGKTINQYPSDQIVAISQAISQSQAKAMERVTPTAAKEGNMVGMLVKYKI